MLVKAKIIDVTERLHKEKKVADVVLMFSEPTDVSVSTLWNNSVQKGEHKPYAELAGQEVYLAVRPDVFNGKLQMNINTQVPPQPVKAPLQAAANKG